VQNRVQLNKPKTVRLEDVETESSDAREKLDNVHTLILKTNDSIGSRIFLLKNDPLSGCPGLFAKHAEIGIVAQQDEPIEDKGQTFGTQRRVGFGDMQMQMRAGGLTGETQAGDGLASLYFLTWPDPDAAGLQVFIEYKLTLFDLYTDEIARSLFGWVFRMLRERRALFEVIPCLHDYAIDHGQHFLRIAVPVADGVFVAFGIFTLSVQQDEVHGESTRNAALPVDGKDYPSMAPLPRWLADGGPGPAVEGRG
jgi:hypothetical protein